MLGTTFLGMFFSGVLTSMLWIEVASACSTDRMREQMADLYIDARGFIPVAKAALISSGVVSCATFFVCFLGYAFSTHARALHADRAGIQSG